MKRISFMEKNQSELKYQANKWYYFTRIKKAVDISLTFNYRGPILGALTYDI